MSGASTFSELQRLLSSSSEGSRAGTPFLWIEEINPLVSLSKALARLPPAPPRRREAPRQRPTNLDVEPVHTFPPTQNIRTRAEEVGRRVRRRVAAMTRTVRLWVARHRR